MKQFTSGNWLSRTKEGDVVKNHTLKRRFFPFNQIYFDISPITNYDGHDNLRGSSNPPRDIFEIEMVKILVVNFNK